MTKPPPAPPEPIALRRRDPRQVVKVEKNSKVLRFYHSGDLGDVIFSLPTIRALGGGVLFLGPLPTGFPYWTRENMTPERAQVLIPLLKLQPYITDCVYSDKPRVVAHNLNQFRFEMQKHGIHENLACLHLKTFDQPLSHIETQWLQVDRAISLPEHPVLVTKTLRYPGLLDWTRVVETYGDEIAFVGTEQEYRSFCAEHRRSFCWARTKDFLEVARLIAGCKLYISNQGGCHAVAEGLKANLIQEPCPSSHTAMFFRPNAWYELPEKLPSMKVVREPLNIIFSGPYDGFSAVGQDSVFLMTGLHKFGHNVWNQPTRFNEGYDTGPPPLPFVRKGPPPKNAIHLVYETVEEFRNPILVREGDFVLTLWESSVWPEYCVRQCNMARQVITFSKWNAETLRHDGCRVPIHVISLGLMNKHVHSSFKPLDVVTFGAAGKICPGGQRKGIEDIVQAFRLAFPRHVQDVKLRIKLYPDCNFPKAIDDPRIEPIRKYMQPDELAEWYRGNLAFVSASRAEGWGKCLHDAMASGSCPIACNYGGQAEFFDARVGYEIPYTLGDCNTEVYIGYGQWAFPSLNELVLIMRRVYLMREEAAEFGQKAAARAVQFTWRRTISELERAICTSLS